MSTPVVDLAAKTVTLDSITFRMGRLTEDEFTVHVDGTQVGRAVFSFGAANAVVESPTVTEDTLWAVADAWFTQLNAGAE
ncbi:MAG: hypothetical protein U0359_06635 [Byssovorax sp.]